MDVLDCSDETGGLFTQERKGLFQHCNIEVHLPRQEYDPLLLINGRMAEVDEHVSRCERIKREVAGTVTRIAADNHIEPCILKGRGIIRCPSFQAGRELESNALCPPLPQCRTQSEISSDNMHPVVHFDLHEGFVRAADIGAAPLDRDTYVNDVGSSNF